MPKRSRKRRQDQREAASRVEQSIGNHQSMTPEEQERLAIARIRREMGQHGAQRGRRRGLKK